MSPHPETTRQPGDGPRGVNGCKDTAVTVLLVAAGFLFGVSRG